MRKIRLVIFVICFVLVNCINVWATEQGNSWEVRSEYFSPLPGSSKSVIIWHFTAHKLQNGNTVVKVIDTKRCIGSRAELFLDQNGGVQKVECYRLLAGNENREKIDCDPLKPAIIKQSIIPLDWLNYSPEENINKDFILKEKIGNSVFSTHYKVKLEDISFTEAEAEGMISKYNKTLFNGLNLHLIVVERYLGDNSSIVLRQLWGDSQDFWLYEDKGGCRQSWRLPTIK